jgi:hypothetical protein
MTTPETNPNAQNAVGCKVARRSVSKIRTDPAATRPSNVFQHVPQSDPRLAGSFHLVAPDYARILYVFRLANLDNRALLSEGW